MINKRKNKLINKINKLVPKNYKLVNINFKHFRTKELSGLISEIKQNRNRYIVPIQTKERKK